MLDALSRLLEHIHLAPHERQVKEYLETATRESIQRDLQRVLKPLNHPSSSASFHPSCIKDADQKSQWTRKSLEKHITSSHPDSALSCDSIDLLWRCLHYYAYHPFPQEATGEAIDPDAFNRAVALLAHGGTCLLGTQDVGGYHWRNHDDTQYICRANIARMLRSIGRPETVSLPPAEHQKDTPSVLSDVVDVLATTQPYSINQAPSPERLDITARELLTEEPATPTRWRVSRRDVSLLIALLLHLRVSPTRKWDRTRYFGCFAPSDRADEHLATCLIQGIMPEDRDYDADGLAGIPFDTLPNLLPYFHQLWTVLFQPPWPSPQEEAFIPDATEHRIPARILTALSLFLPIPHLLPTDPGSTFGMKPISFQEIEMPSTSPTCSEMAQAVQGDDTPRIILATNENHTQAIGAFMPASLQRDAGDGTTRECTVGKTHLFFYLGQDFRVLQCKNQPRHLSKTRIWMDDEAKGEASSMRAYCVGDGIKRTGAARLHFDPARTTASLLGVEGPNMEGYENVKSCQETVPENWEVVINPSRVYVFSLVL
ncbi:hypothetical protein BO86DRAFT_404479 [Aspergillus japonicus CBS 114.51]|uniref:TLDc domain-containing protein n=1 Tax=Aspergillus japonicus CBS 114.51 TaxID=1448312 RepID=A0A8T8WL98_ASPJA|nr:hypothetical protein BO86DRAFT_404479 [Aspergillus japonicus CBS 114.51]RAH76618.1 hypothetical protein BO86DRAFT_404479 [Aspergillus japonicus CBS 114.51]